MNSKIIAMTAAMLMLTACGAEAAETETTTATEATTAEATAATEAPEETTASEITETKIAEIEYDETKEPVEEITGSLPAISLPKKTKMIGSVQIMKMTSYTEYGEMLSMSTELSEIEKKAGDIMEELELWVRDPFFSSDESYVAVEPDPLDIISYTDMDLDGDGNTECLYVIRSERTNQYIIYTDNNGKPHVIFSGENFYVHSLFNYSDFSHVIINSNDENRFVVLEIADNKITEICAENNDMVTPEIHSEIADAIIESSDNMAMLHGCVEYTSSEDAKKFVDYDNTLDITCKNGEFSGWYYVAINPDYAKNADALYTRIRSSISEKLVSNEKMKELLFGEFERDSFDTSETETFTFSKFRTNDGQLGMLEAYEPKYGYTPYRETLIIHEYNGTSAVGTLYAMDPGGDYDVITCYMEKNKDNGWCLYNMKTAEWPDRENYCYWKDLAE